MAEPLRDPGADTDTEPAFTGAPRWVKVSGIIGAVLILLVVLMMVFGGGRHGPGRHLPSGGRTSPDSGQR